MNTGFFAGNNKKTKPILKLFFTKGDFLCQSFAAKIHTPTAIQKINFLVPDLFFHLTFLLCLHELILSPHPPLCTLTL